MRRRRATIIAAALLGLGQAWLGAAAQGTGEAVEEVAPEAEKTLYATPTRRDRVGRILAPVEINGRGTFRFILDTGANRSAVSPRLVAALGMDPAAMAPVSVHGVTGTADLPVVELESLRAGEVDLGPVRAPVLDDSVFAGADGILGIVGLQQSRIRVDFKRDLVTIERSTGRRAPSGYLTVPARAELGGLLVVEGSVGKVNARVIIDTGAERTLGNIALRDQLIDQHGSRQSFDTTVIGATPDTQQGLTFVAPQVSIGVAYLHNLPVTFGDMHVFEIWGLTGEPALLIGMDLLGTLERFVVDYGRQEFWLRTYRQKGVKFNRCTLDCGTRLPRTQ